MLWELDMARVPVDPRERIAGWNMLMKMVEDAMKSGGLTDWGNFAGMSAGYAIFEGTEEDLHRGNIMYFPYVKFETHPVLSASQSIEAIKALPQS
jgi:hypothetical protein